MHNIVLEYLLGSNELGIRFIKNSSSTKYFYSIYGDNNFNLKGLFDVSDDIDKHIPRLIIDVGENTIFFIKVKNMVNEKIIEEFKFVELEKLKKKQNLSMNILDKKTENLFMSINMDDGDSDSEKSVSDTYNDTYDSDRDRDSDTNNECIDTIQLNTFTPHINEVINMELVDNNT
tara:strand:- start:21 stop:545 length:525 start_codon:yes stop_codon:yes gene_type:complete